ncbi:MAG: Asd/ArgC dimerization domain-containing protein, partial [Candidatus Margulisiibacteriota bacterium]
DVVSDIIIDAKSGVSGAGKKLDEMYLFANLHNNFKAYGIAIHRHQPEIEAYLGQPIEFVPHLLPINRGILSTIYIRSKCSLEDLREKLTQAYEDEPFVSVLTKGSPEISMVAGTNHCYLSVHKASRPGMFILVSALDNLIKGASGQAVQNMNLMLDLPETVGLDLVPSYP